MIRFAAAAGCGLALGLAFPPYGLWPLAVLAIAGLSLTCRGVPAGRGAVLGGLAGTVFFLVLLRWLTVVGVDAWVALALLEAAFWGLLGAGLAVLPRLPAAPVWSACLWVLVELARASVPFGGFPWGRVAFALVDSPALRWVSVGGAPLLSFAAALAGTLLAAAVVAVRARRVHRAGTALLGAAAVLVAPLGLPAADIAGAPRVSVAVVQGNVPELGLHFLGRPRAVLGNHVQATRRLAAAVDAGRLPAPDVVIWPENASDVDPFADPLARRQISAAVRAVGVPTLVGTLVSTPEGDRVENSGIVWSPRTGPGERYVKRHPVPFGEYIPYRDVVARWFDRLDQIPRDFAAGTRPGILDLGPVRVGDVICFEVAYDGLVRDVVTGGAQLLVVQTNNATYGRTGQPEQQFAISRLRAVEHGRAMVVAATSGISGLVTGDGSVLARSAEFTTDLLVADVPVLAGTTVATRLGAWPEWLLSAAAVLGLLLAWRRGRAAGRPAVETEPGRRRPAGARVSAAQGAR